MTLISRSRHTGRKHIQVCRVFRAPFHVGVTSRHTRQHKRNVGNGRERSFFPRGSLFQRRVTYFRAVNFERGVIRSGKRLPANDNSALLRDRYASMRNDAHKMRVSSTVPGKARKRYSEREAGVEVHEGSVFGSVQNSRRPLRYTGMRCT